MMLSKIFKKPSTLAIISFAFMGCSIFNPAAVQPEKIYGTEPAPLLLPGQKVKIMSWNIQYMAGKNYVFFYDLIDGSGPDTRPSSKDIAKTLTEVAQIIRKENPDIILLQEVDEHARRTDYENQLAKLLNLLPDEYKFHASAFYWKSSFVPHPKIMGSVGMKLSTISKYKISAALRRQLPLRRVSAPRSWFDLKRAVIETRLPIHGDRELVVMNTHLSAFAQGEDTMQRQVQQLKARVDQLTQQGVDWIIGGDFNLLPTREAYQRLPDHQKAYYQEKTELEPLISIYPSVPSIEEISGPAPQKWYTYFSNDPRVSEPDRTIDYIFYSTSLKLGPHQVVQKQTLHISDHLPIVAEFELPP